MLDAELIVDLPMLEGLRSEWDALAVACGLPLMSPAWILAWWSHLAPVTAQPRVVAVRDGGELVGLAPFFVEPDDRRHRVDYRLPGIELSARLAPLARPGREWQVARAIAAALSSADPRPDVIALEGAPVTSPWPLAFRETWPGPLRPVVRQYNVYGCPTIALRGGSFDAWLNGKSANFRGQMRRLRRQFESAGGSARVSTIETVRSDVDTLVRLHSSRWKHLGESNLVAFGDRLAPMLEDVGRRQLADGRFDLRLLEIDGEPVSAQLFLHAGGQALYVNSGWDERFASFKPPMLGILGTIEDAFARGEERIDLGLGEQAYKLRFADGSDPVAWTIVVPARLRLPVTRLRTASLLGRVLVRDTAKRMLSREHADRLQALRGRLRGR